MLHFLVEKGVSDQIYGIEGAQRTASLGNNLRSQNGVQFLRDDTASYIEALFTKLFADSLDLTSQVMAVRASSREQDLQFSFRPDHTPDVLSRQVDGFAERRFPLALELFRCDGDGVCCLGVSIIVHQVDVQSVRILKIDPRF